MNTEEEHARLIGEEGMRQARENAATAPPLSDQLRAELSLLLARTRPITKKPRTAA
jgi:hypothetical protein